MSQSHAKETTAVVRGVRTSIIMAIIITKFIEGLLYKATNLPPSVAYWWLCGLGPTTMQTAALLGKGLQSGQQVTSCSPALRLYSLPRAWGQDAQRTGSYCSFLPACEAWGNLGTIKVPPREQPPAQILGLQI